MKRILIAFIAIISANTAVAQATGQVSLSQGGGGGLNGDNAAIAYLLGPITDRDQKARDLEYGIQGSAYTSEGFEAGKLYYNNEFEGGTYYRYNAYNEEIEVTKANLPGVPVRILNRDKAISLVTATGNSVEFKTYIDKKNRTQNGYLTKLRTGKYTLYKRFDVKYTQGQKAQNSFIPAIPARFTKFTEYYMKIDGIDRIDELELSNRKLLKLIPEEHKTDFKNYLKENKIKIKNEYDVFKIIDHFNK